MWRKHKACLDNQLSVRQSPIPPKNISPSGRPNDIITDVMLQVLPIYRHSNYHTQLSTGKNLRKLIWSDFETLLELRLQKGNAASGTFVCRPVCREGGKKHITTKKKWVLLQKQDANLLVEEMWFCFNWDRNHALTAAVTYSSEQVLNPHGLWGHSKTARTNGRRMKDSMLPLALQVAIGRHIWANYFGILTGFADTHITPTAERSDGG